MLSILTPLPEEAVRIMRELHFHFTPKHASWPNGIEIELSGLVKQCLNRHLPDIDSLRTRVDAWQQRRNAARHRSLAVWRWATRAKLGQFYP